MAIGVTRGDLDAAGLRAAGSACRDGSAARRMLALALESESRTAAARVCGMDRQTLRDWVHRYNAERLEGLTNRHGGMNKPFGAAGDEQHNLSTPAITGA